MFVPLFMWEGCTLGSRIMEIKEEEVYFLRHGRLHKNMQLLLDGKNTMLGKSHCKLNDII